MNKNKKNLIKTADYTGPDRRKFSRINDNLFLLYQIGNRWRMAENVSKNIGGGGLLFESDRFISPSTTLKMEITVPMDNEKIGFISFGARAKVIWTKQIKEANPYKGANHYKIGIKFARIKEEHRKRIADYVRKYSQARD